MRWFSMTLALAASAWLAGCAAPGSFPDSDSPDATATATVTDAASSARHGEMPDVAVSELRRDGVAPLEAPADLWERIRRGFAMPDLQDDLVARHEDWYSARPDYIERMVERSRMYIFHVVEELELRGMPTELALLPFIESAFNPQAVSSAKAAGLWQFMPGTGRDFQLTQNILRDDRRAVVDSTRAALDYLQKLHDMFGDWHLALAAYNWGQGNVQRAINRNQAAGLGTGYLDLNMPAETRNYVPKLQAVKNIIAQPERYSAVLPLIGNHPFFDAIDIQQDIDVDVAARLAEVRLEDFRALNPAQRKPVIFAAGTPQILLPWENAATFQKNLAKANPASLASWTAWVATSTQPSREVASRFGMDDDEFRQINNIPRGMVIKSGSTVLVRRSAGAAAAVPSQVVNNASLAYSPEIVLRRTTVRARRGDTIASISDRYDLPAATVARWNKTGAHIKLRRGQAVVLYLPVRAAAAAARERVHATHRQAVASQAREAGKSRAGKSKTRDKNNATGAKGKSKGKTAGAKDRASSGKKPNVTRPSAKPSTAKSTPKKASAKPGARTKR